MIACVEFIRKYGAIERIPGGFWVQPGTSATYPSFGTTTVEALVKRGAAKYTDWKENRNGRFPIKAELTQGDEQP